MATVTSSRMLALYGQSPRVYPPAPIVLTADTPVAGIGTLGGINNTAQSAAATANAASNTANAAVNGLANKLSNGAANVMASGFSMKTPNYDAGYGMVFYDGGLISKWGGDIKYVFDAQSGNQTFTGTLDCGNGAIIRTRNLGSNGETVDLVNFQLASGAQFGRIYQGQIHSPQSYAAGLGFNFHAPGGHAGAMLEAINTANGQGGRLGIASNGEVFCGTSGNGGGAWGWVLVAVANGVVQSGLNADMLDGRHAADFSGALHAHPEYAATGHTHSGYAAAGHSHTFWVPQTYTIDLYNEAGTTYIGSYQVRLKATSYWWSYNTST